MVSIQISLQIFFFVLYNILFLIYSLNFWRIIWLFFYLYIIIILLRWNAVIYWIYIIKIMKILKWLFNYTLITGLMTFCYVTMSVNVTLKYWWLTSCMNITLRPMTNTLFLHLFIFKYHHIVSLFFLLLIFLYLGLNNWCLWKLLLIELNIRS